MTHVSSSSDLREGFQGVGVENTPHMTHVSSSSDLREGFQGVGVEDT
jgi:hypothetical protein